MQRGRRIVVLGSNSFSGSDFIDLLIEDERNHVVGISRSPEKEALFLPYKRRADAKFKFYQFDLNHNVPELLGLFDSFRPQYVVNFAAQSEVAPSWEHPEHWFLTNTVALAKFTRALIERDYVERYVHISSPEVYGSCEGRVTESAPLNPSTPYAASKAAADLLLATMAKNFDFPLVTIRATNVYGPGQQPWKIIPRAAIYLKLGRSIPLHGGGRAVKSFIHVRDVSRGEAAAMENGRRAEIYHLSPEGYGYRVRDVVERICRLMNKEFSNSVEIVDERPGQDAAYIIDSVKARLEFGWAPSIPLDRGLAEAVRWVEDHWGEIRRHPLEYVHRE